MDPPYFPFCSLDQNLKKGFNLHSNGVNLIDFRTGWGGRAAFKNGAVSRVVRFHRSSKIVWRAGHIKVSYECLIPASNADGRQMHQTGRLKPQRKEE